MFRNNDSETVGAIAFSFFAQVQKVLSSSCPFLYSQVTTARFLDVFALCLSHNSVFTGALDKLMLARPSTIGYLPSVAELKSSPPSSSDYQTVVDAVPSDVSNFRNMQGKAIQNTLNAVKDVYELPRMPPWFVYVGSEKLYQALAGILRLVGLSLMAGHLNTCSFIFFIELFIWHSILMPGIFFFLFVARLYK